jgi:hypothetical protein
MKDGSFRKHVDVLLFPDIAQSVIESGEPSSPERRQFFSPLPPEYSGGIEPDGGEQIKEWVEEGGTIVALDSSADYLIDLFRLPLRRFLSILHTRWAMDCAPRRPPTSPTHRRFRRGSLTPDSIGGSWLAIRIIETTSRSPDTSTVQSASSA